MAEQVKFLPPPESCDCCGSIRVSFQNNSIVYGGRSYGAWPYIYWCEDCDASVACHPQTRNPMGLLANKQTRQLRKAAHTVFDQIHANGFMTRKDAYAWMTDVLKIKREDAHISQLSDTQLNELIKQCEIYLCNNTVADLRRKEKKDAKLARDSKQRRERWDGRRKTKKPKFSRHSG